MLVLECACDGGKDSLSMAAAAGGETVMAPGNLVVSAYVGCPDVTKVVTPDLKLAAEGGQLLHVDLASVPGARRLGGSALAQAYNQLGSDCPDVVPAQLKAAWNAVQALVKQGLVSAGHDISDGGIATTLLEMAFAGRSCTQLVLTLSPVEPDKCMCWQQQTAFPVKADLYIGGHTRVTRMSNPRGMTQRLLPPRSHLCA